MKNKKVFLLILLAFCAMQFFAVESERIIKKLPAGVNEKSVCAFHMWGENQFDFIYKAGDKYFINLCGKKIGPFKYRPSLFHPRENFAYTFRDENENVHLVLDGKELGVYEDFYFFIFMSEPGKYIYNAKKDGAWYIITEEKSYGPFEKKVEFALRKKDGSICFCVQEDGFDYVYTDGEKRGPYIFVDSASFFGEVDSFIYRWADPHSCEYHLCVEGKDSEAYNSINFFASLNGRTYYIWETNDFKSTYIMCDAKILKEFSASDYETSPSSARPIGDVLCVSLGKASNYAEKCVLLLKDGEIKAELKTEAGEAYEENPFFPFFDYWISCPAGKFGPYFSIELADFDRFGRAVWCIRNESGEYELYIDGKLISKLDDGNWLIDFDVLDDRYIFVSEDFDTLIVNDKKYAFGSGHIIVDPRLLAGGDDFIFYSYSDDYLGQKLFQDGKFYKSFSDEKYIYYIEGNSMKRRAFE